MTQPNPTKAQTLAGLGHAIATIYTLAAQVLEPEQWPAAECAAAVDGLVKHLRVLAPHLETLQQEAGATVLQQALYLARAQVHAGDGPIGNALATARAGAVLNHWLRTLASLHSQESGSGPLTLGELFERVGRMRQDPRQSIALEEQTKERALDTSARHLIDTAAQLSDQALGLLWLSGTLTDEQSNDLSQTAANLFSQASGIVLCGAGLLSSEPFGAPQIDESDEAPEAKDAAA